jgi:hypothetical protein
MTHSNSFRVILPLICLFMLVCTAPANAIIAEHISFNCGCHNLHNSVGANLLIALNSELTCLSCHGPLGTATEVTSHNPGGLTPGQQGYVTCRECHDAHNNQGGNVKMVGYNWDPEVGPTKFTVPTIRVELSTTDPVAPPVYRQVTFTANTDFNIDNMIGGRGICEICHSPFHNRGRDCTTCHQHATGFKPAGGCAGCHDGTGVEALAVGPDSPHSITATGYSCADCHNSHRSGTIEIPNNPAVGIYYVANNEGGISLGSSTVPGATEAEICWNCHASEGVSEWGTNTHAATGNSPYNYGSLDQPNWTTATWSSTNFSYKTGAIQSIHAVDGLATTPGLDPVEAIRCSYCHDVHELALATGDAAAGKPYLRGTWKGNPYKEDGAPSGAWNTYTSPTLLKWGAVPRGLNTNSTLGGYQIDQNNGSPTSTWTIADSAGLCILCHNQNQAGTAVSVDTLDWFGTNDWIGTNGHSNAVIGGTGVNRANIYNPNTRAEGTAWNQPGMAYNNVTTKASSDWMLGLRNLGGGGYSYVQTDTTTTNSRGVTPPIYIGTSGNQRYTYTHSISWGVDFNTITAQTQYHRFSCSKCHNPHASRLPRLMITNCLDVQHNTWDGNFINDGDWTAGKASATYNFSTSNIFKVALRGTSDAQGLRNKQLAYATSAQNCHRYIDINGNKFMDVDDEPGWNKVTPW